LETVEPHSDAFIADYFCEDEKATMLAVPGHDRAQVVALLWSAKESALKALQEGLRMDARSVVVCVTDACAERDYSDVFSQKAWRPLNVCHRPDFLFHGWWSCAGGVVRTVAAAPAPRPPVMLTVLAPKAVAPSHLVCERG
jgi:phosphopantetheinyl transferase